MSVCCAFAAMGGDCDCNRGIDEPMENANSETWRARAEAAEAENEALREALEEADRVVQRIAGSAETEDTHVAIIAAVEAIRALKDPDTAPPLIWAAPSADCWDEGRFDIFGGEDAMEPYVPKARAEAAEARLAPRPFSEAPRDGTEVLVFWQFVYPGDKSRTCGWDIAWWEGGHWEFCSDDTPEAIVTHWWPLPDEPPAP